MYFISQFGIKPERRNYSLNWDYPDFVLKYLKTRFWWSTKNQVPYIGYRYYSILQKESDFSFSWHLHVQNSFNVTKPVHES